MTAAPPSRRALTGGSSGPWRRPACRGATRLTKSRGRGALLTAVVAATLPMAFAAVRALRHGWLPVWDNAYVAIRAQDVFSSGPPLVGTRSSASAMAAHPVSHPGPGFAHADLVGGIEGTAADAAEMARREATLRRALDRAGGLPVRAMDQPIGTGDAGDTDADDAGQDALRRRLADLVDDVEALDTDAVLGSQPLSELLAALEVFGLTDRAFDDDFPVDDLVRYEELRAQQQGARVRVWLERPSAG